MRGTGMLTIERLMPNIPVPRITQILQSETNLLIWGTNGPANQTYYLLAATNITDPLTNWQPVATSVFDAGGNFSVTNALDSNLMQRFYRLQVP